MYSHPVSVDQRLVPLALHMLPVLVVMQLALRMLPVLVVMQLQRVVLLALVHMLDVFVHVLMV